MGGDGMDAATESVQYTIEDIYHLPDGKRAELIDGELYMMATPNKIHQRIVMELSFRIRDYIGRNHGECEIFSAPFAVFLYADDKTYIEPDISVICDKNKLTEEGCMGAPDWILEVVSPSSKRMDYYVKLFKYRTAGVREYWVVNPMDQRVTVYNFEQDVFEEFLFSDIVKAGIFENLEIDFSQISME